MIYRTPRAAEKKMFPSYARVFDHLCPRFRWVDVFLERGMIVYSLPNTATITSLEIDKEIT